MGRKTTSPNGGGGQSTSYLSTAWLDDIAENTEKPRPAGYLSVEELMLTPQFKGKARNTVNDLMRRAVMAGKAASVTWLDPVSRRNKLLYGPPKKA